MQGMGIQNNHTMICIVLNQLFAHRRVHCDTMYKKNCSNNMLTALVLHRGGIVRRLLGYVQKSCGKYIQDQKRSYLIETSHYLIETGSYLIKTGSYVIETGSFLIENGSYVFPNWVEANRVIYMWVQT